MKLKFETENDMFLFQDLFYEIIYFYKNKQYGCYFFNPRFKNNINRLIFRSWFSLLNEYIFNNKKSSAFDDLFNKSVDIFSSINIFILRYRARNRICDVGDFNEYKDKPSLEGIYDLKNNIFEIEIPLNYQNTVKDVFHIIELFINFRKENIIEFLNKIFQNIDSKIIQEYLTHMIECFFKPDDFLIKLKNNAEKYLGGLL